MSGVKEFFRRLSYREPKQKKSSKSASTSNIPLKSQQLNESENSNIPYCLRQLQQDNASLTRVSTARNGAVEANNRRGRSKSQDSVSVQQEDQHSIKGRRYYNDLKNESELRAPRHDDHMRPTSEKRLNNADQTQQHVSYGRTHNVGTWGGGRNHTSSKVNTNGAGNYPNNFMSADSSYKTSTYSTHGSKVQKDRPPVQNYNTWQNGTNSARNDEQWNVEDVTLSKKRQGQGMGFTIAGGLDAPSGIYIDEKKSVFIQKIVSGGLALEDGRLKPGDIILSINGTSAQGATHLQVVQLLRSAGSHIQLKVKRRTNMKGKLVEIQLKKDKKDSGLGLSVSGGVGTPEYSGDDGIFVTKIFPGSVADRNGTLSMGDKIISVNDVSVMNKTHDEAVGLLRTAGLSRDVVTLQILKRKTHDDIKNDEDVCDGQAIYTKVVKPRPAYNNNQMQQPTMNNSLQSRNNLSSTSSSTLPKPRQVVLVRTDPQKGLGFNVVGGVGGHGIYVNYVIPESLADRTSDLKRGDKLLKVNNSDLTRANHVEAISVLKGAHQRIVIIAQYKPEELEDFEKWMSQIQPEKNVSFESKQSSHHEISADIVNNTLLSKDNLFVRSMFDYDPFLDVSYSPYSPGPADRLKVKFGEIFRISRTGLGEVWWKATKVLSLEFTATNQNKDKLFTKESGFIPGKTNPVLKLLMEKSLLFEIDLQNSDVRTSKKRRSFIMSSKLKPSIKNEKSDRKSAQKGDKNCFYEPVLLRNCLHTRPVIIFGPLKDKMNELLVQKCPQLYDVCVPHTTRPMRPGEVSGREYVFVLTKEEMQRDIDDDLFTEVGVYNNHFYGISFDSIRTIAKQHKHCLADVSIETIHRLHSSDIFPIVLLLKPTSNKLLSAWLGTTDEEKIKNVIEQNNLLFRQHKNSFTAVVRGETEEELYKEVRKVVDAHGKSHVWTSSDEKI